MASDPRTDPHRPSALDPADYVQVGASDQAEYWGETSFFYINHDRLREHCVDTGNHNNYSPDGVVWYDPTEDGRARYRCHHCGKHGENIRYFVFFLHKPSGKVIVVGRDCAKRLNMGSKEELDVQKQAREWRRQHEWINDHPEAVDHLREYDEQREAGGIYIDFYDSLLKHLATHHQLTERQLAGLQRWMSRDKPWEREQSGSDRRAGRDAGDDPTNVSGPAPVVPKDGDRHKAEVTHTEEEPTEPQMDLIRNLCEKLGREFSIITADTHTRLQASDLINELKAEWETKKPPAPPATPAQLKFINDLMEKRSLPLHQRREVRAKIDAGLTKSQASVAIEWLQTFPERS